MRKSIALIALALASIARAETAKTTAPPKSDPRAPIVEALARGETPLAQARNLTALAWPASGKRDEAVAASARQELENFGGHSLVALGEAINAVKPEYTEEVVRTTMFASQAAAAGAGREYLGVLVDALWVGSRGAKELAIRSMLGDRPNLAVQPMIDSALEDEALAPLVVPSLGTMHYEQARFYLEKVMIEGPPALRPVAAASLSQIGGAALKPLKNALKAPDRDTRLLAARALLPAATEFELGALYEYVNTYGTDDPALTSSIKTSAAVIEKAIAAREAANAASAPDF